MYTSILTSDDEAKATFHNHLDHTLQTAPAHGKLVVLGDFNVRVGKDHLLWDGIVSHHSIGNTNASAQLLLGFCVELELVITNILFGLSPRLKISWKHARSTHWHMLDYILNRTRDSHHSLHAWSGRLLERPSKTDLPPKVQDTPTTEAELCQ